MKPIPILSTLLIAGFALASSGTGPEVTGMDKSVSPTADFFEYANGGWLAKTQIPADKAGVGTFLDLHDRNQKILREVAEEAANDPKLDPKTSRGKVGLFYKVALDQDRADRLGYKPIEPELQEIAAIKDQAGLASEIAKLQAIGVNACFRAGVGQDQKNSSEQIFELRQGGLGLPTKDSYLSDSDRAQELRDRYLAMVTKGFELVGDSEDSAKQEANEVLDLETKFAKASRSPVQLRDINANYNRTDLAGVEAEAKGFDWDRYFAAVGKSNPGPINVGQPDFFKSFAGDVQSVPLDTWKAYLRHQLIAEASPFLSSDFEKNSFSLAGSLRGVTAQQPRWERALGTTDRALGEAIGQLWVQKAFPPSAKARALALVQNLKAVLRDRIGELDWMSPETKAQAIKKLDAMRIKIGYPDHWRDYSKLAVKDDSYVQNVFRSREFAHEEMLSHLGKPVDRNRWGMTPPTVNAYYSAPMNEIVFPAGILQPPFFDPSAPDAMNYGGIGAVIGHEMTHGFDDHGSQYDGQGNLRNWWTDEDAKKFKERAEALAKQYDGYVVTGDVHLNGHLTLGENIADLGGLKIAWLAYKKATKGKEQPTIEGFTPDQQFFLAFAQIWREKGRPQSERMRAQTDPHSAPRYRVIGVMQNTPEFWKAWGAQPPANEIAIW